MVKKNDGNLSYYSSFLKIERREELERKIKKIKVYSEFERVMYGLSQLLLFSVASAFIFLGAVYFSYSVGNNSIVWAAFISTLLIAVIMYVCALDIERFIFKSKMNMNDEIQEMKESITEV